MDTKRIAVVMGGPSEEHEISLKTGLEIVSHLDKDKYQVCIIVIDRQKRFFRAIDYELVTLDDLTDPAHSPLFKGPFSPAGAISLWNDVDLVFSGLHGEFGENGVFQGYLETIGLPYVGSNVVTSAIGMHKIHAKKIFEASGIPTPPYSVYRRGDSIQHIASKHSLPCFVKAPQSGSSKLLGIAHTLEELEEMLTTWIKISPTILVETMIDGEEFSCPVLESANGTPRALLPIFIKPLNGKEFFDYEAKYMGKSEDIVPPPHDAEIIEIIQKAALAVHKVLECRGFSRTDILLKDNVPYVLEVNTLPGFTAQSLFPMAYAAEGGTFSELLNELIESSLCANFG